MKKLYCVSVKRELEDMYIFHVRFEKEPTYDEVLKLIEKEDIKYDDDYGKFSCREVKV